MGRLTTGRALHSANSSLNNCWCLELGEREFGELLLLLLGTSGTSFSPCSTAGKKWGVHTHSEEAALKWKKRKPWATLWTTNCEIYYTVVTYKDGKAFTRVVSRGADGAPSTVQWLQGCRCFGCVQNKRFDLASPWVSLTAPPQKAH